MGDGPKAFDDTLRLARVRRSDSVSRKAAAHAASALEALKPRAATSIGRLQDAVRLFVERDVVGVEFAGVAQVNARFFGQFFGVISS